MNYVDARERAITELFDTSALKREVCERIVDGVLKHFFAYEPMADGFYLFRRRVIDRWLPVTVSNGLCDSHWLDGTQRPPDGEWAGPFGGPLTPDMDLCERGRAYHPHRAEPEFVTVDGKKVVQTSIASSLPV